jgi:hypothetical protein
MKQPEVFKKIGGIIQEIQEQYEYLQASAENLNDLELELFVANTHFLKDHAEILRKLNLLKQPEQPLVNDKPQIAETPKPAEEDKPVEEDKLIVGEPRYFEPVVQQKPIERTPFKPEVFNPPATDAIRFELATPVNEEPAPQVNLGNGTVVDSYSFEREEPKTIRHELIVDEAETRDEEENTPRDEYEKTDEKPNVESTVIEPDVQVTEAEQPVPTNPEPVIDNQPKTKAEPEPAEEDKPLSLNQKIAAQLKEKQAATDQLVDAPITNIKTAINLNDKMLFIKELFHGYPLAYSEAIEIVNRFNTFEEADRFLKTNYVTKNNWETKKAVSEKFYALLKRRYA